MPRLRDNQLPAYRRHRASGQAIVGLGGETHYLGPHGSATSRKEYDRLIQEWIAAGRPRGSLVPSTYDSTVTELILRYMDHVRTYYAGAYLDKNENHYKVALRVVRTLYGPTLATEFGPVALAAVREKFVAAGWGRMYVNQQTSRVRRMFLWAVAQEIIPPGDRVNALGSLENLHKGRTTAHEPRKILPVADAHLEKVIASSSPQVAAMMQLQRLTGMRPGEVCKMRVRDVIKGKRGEPWIYRMEEHKTIQHGVSGDVRIGPRAQAVLQPFLGREPEEYLFRPSEALAWLRAKRTAAREDGAAKGIATPTGHGNGPGTNVVRRPKRKAGDRYTVASYRRAITYACDQAFPLPEELGPARIPKASGKGTRLESRDEWKSKLTAEKLAAIDVWRENHRFHPHQIRHTAATHLRAQYGVEAAQVLLRHKTLAATQIYAEKNVKAADKIAVDVG